MTQVRRHTLVLAALLLGSCARKPPPANPLVEKGKQLYATYCATCHGVSGNGYVADNAPSLRTEPFLATASDVFLQAAIARGTAGNGDGRLRPALGGPLSPQDVKAIIAFLREGGPTRDRLPPGPVVGDASEGKLVYDAMCARCHGTQTQRSTAVHLANPVLLETATDVFLRHAVDRGAAADGDARLEGHAAGRSRSTTSSRMSGRWPSRRACPRRRRPPPSRGPAAPPRQGPIVLNPRGARPTFTLRDDLYVSIDQVKAALDRSGGSSSPTRARLPTG